MNSNKLDGPLRGYAYPIPGSQSRDGENSLTGKTEVTAALLSTHAFYVPVFSFAVPTFSEPTTGSSRAPRHGIFT